MAITVNEPKWLKDEDQPLQAGKLFWHQNYGSFNICQLLQLIEQIYGRLSCPQEGMHELFRQNLKSRGLTAELLPVCTKHRKLKIALYLALGWCGIIFSPWCI